MEYYIQTTQGQRCSGDPYGTGKSSGSGSSRPACDSYLLLTAYGVWYIIKNSYTYRHVRKLNAEAATCPLSRFAMKNPLERARREINSEKKIDWNGLPACTSGEKNTNKTCVFGHSQLVRKRRF